MKTENVDLRECGRAVLRDLGSVWRAGLGLSKRREILDSNYSTGESERQQKTSLRFGVFGFLCPLFFMGFRRAGFQQMWLSALRVDSAL